MGAPKLLLTLVAMAAFVGTASARIGWTLEQCRATYGQEVGPGREIWTTNLRKPGAGEMEYHFRPDFWEITVLVVDGKVVAITYRKLQPDAAGHYAISMDELAQLFSKNLESDEAVETPNCSHIWVLDHELDPIPGNPFPIRPEFTIYELTAAQSQALETKKQELTTKDPAGSDTDRKVRDLYRTFGKEGRVLMTGYFLDAQYQSFYLESLAQKEYHKHALEEESRVREHSTDGL